MCLNSVKGKKKRLNFTVKEDNKCPNPFNNYLVLSCNLPKGNSVISLSNRFPSSTPHHRDTPCPSDSLGCGGSCFPSGTPISFSPLMDCTAQLLWPQAQLPCADLHQPPELFLFHKPVPLSSHPSANMALN